MYLRVSLTFFISAGSYSASQKIVPSQWNMQAFNFYIVTLLKTDKKNQQIDWNLK